MKPDKKLKDGKEILKTCLKDMGDYLKSDMYNDEEKRDCFEYARGIILFSYRIGLIDNEEIKILRDELVNAFEQGKKG